MLDYAGIRTLAKQIGTTAKDLLALAVHNDPFYVDVPFRRSAAEWFVGLRDQIDFGYRFHIRRAHYKIISQSTPILKPDGSNYENTDGDWGFLLQASRDARYLELIAPESVIDNRNPTAIINAAFYPDSRPSVEVIGGELGEMVLPANLTIGWLQPEHVDEWEASPGIFTEQLQSEETRKLIPGSLILVHEVARSDFDTLSP